MCNDNPMELCCDIEITTSNNSSSSISCGVQRVTPATTPLPTTTTGKPDPFGFKLGASDTMSGQFPWMVEITARAAATGRHEYKCGGTIIHHNLILTTAHNVMDLKASDLIVKIGVWDISDSAQQYMTRGVSDILTFPDFKPKPPQNDVALLVMNSSLKWSEDVAPVCLPDQTLPYNDAECIAIGWGKTKEGVQHTTLREVDIPLRDHASCQSMLQAYPTLGPSYTLHDSFLCGGGQDSDTCEGDGGGPLMCPVLGSDQKRYVQIGITSWGVKGECYNPLYPGLYSSVAAALQWIQEKQDDYPEVNERINDV